MKQLQAAPLCLLALIATCFCLSAAPPDDLAELRAQIAAERMRGDELAATAVRLRRDAVVMVFVFAATSTALGWAAFRRRASVVKPSTP